MMTTINNEKEITSSSKVLAEEFILDYTLVLFDDDDQLGNQESISVQADFTVNRIFLGDEFHENISSARANQANSYSTGGQPSLASDLVTTAYAYSSSDGKNSRTLLGGHNVDANLQGTLL